MSEAAAETAPASPEQTATSTPAPQTDAQPEAAPQESADARPKPEPITSFREAKRALRERITGAGVPAPTEQGASSDPPAGASEPTPDAKGNLHDPESGKFVEKQKDTQDPEAQEEQEAQPEAAPSPETQDPGDPSVAEATEPEAGDELPEGMVRIELPADHPLRVDRGKTHVTVSKDDEVDVRATLNSYTRRSEAEQARSEVEQTRLEALKAQKEAEFWREHASEVFGPEFRAQYEDIKETYGPEAAERFKRGQLAEAQERLSEHTEAAEKEHQQEVAQQRAREFATRAEQIARKAFPNWNQQGFESALRSFGSLIKNGYAKPTHEAFLQHARTVYLQSPAGQKWLEENGQKAQQEKEKAMREKIEAEAKRREQERLEEAAAKRKQNPMGGLPHVQTDATTPGGEQSSPVNPRDLRQELRKVAYGR